MTVQEPNPNGARASDSDRPPGRSAFATSLALASRENHALEVIEFPALLGVVAGYASSEHGAARVRSLRPMDSKDLATEALTRVEAMRWLITRDDGWKPVVIPDLVGALRRLGTAGSSWSGVEVRSLLTLLVSGRIARGLLERTSDEAAHVAALAHFASALVADTTLERELGRLVDDDGMLRDDASPALRKFRRELRGAEGDLVRLLERVMARLDDHHRVADASVTLRNGRYVIPVRREGRGVVGGIVHDTSASGATLFMEPPAAVEAANRLCELIDDEAREVERILFEVTERLRPRADDFRGVLEALIALDSVYACASYAESSGCSPAGLAGPSEGFAVVLGRHPLLLARSPESVVPFDLAMEPQERTLLVSGPNTGGKTVLLKAVALLSTMTQAGIPAPVGAGSRLPLFDRVFADIGDEQSLEASLSTFSAHLRNLTEIVREATPRSLVLVDELGSGTDPLEGAALGGAILEELTRRGTLSLATTHLGALKQLAHEVEGVVNASLQFDAVALAPTFRLIKGMPGRSYGLSIARRLGMSEQVLGRAEDRVPPAERDVAALLQDLEHRHEVLRERESHVESLRQAQEERETLLEAREVAVRIGERSLQRSARQDARRYVLEARQEIEHIIADLREAGTREAAAAAGEARRRAEGLAAVHAEAVRAFDALPSTAPCAGMETAEEGEIVIGGAVRVATLNGRRGQLVEWRGNDAVVAVGGVKLTVPRAALRRAAGASADQGHVRVSLAGDQPDVVARHEVDLRGMRVDELAHALTQAVDNAVRADLRTLRVIHGKGTGALRGRVAEVLRSDRRVTGFRLGLWNEGGAGVTVASLE